MGDAGLPFGGAGLVDVGALAVDGDGDGHARSSELRDVELVDGLPAEVGEGARRARLPLCQMDAKALEVFAVHGG